MALRFVPGRSWGPTGRSHPRAGIRRALGRALDRTVTKPEGERLRRPGRISPIVALRVSPAFYSALLAAERNALAQVGRRTR
jgi:hypothetical protein